jgi:hypothetical protein
VDEVKKVTLLWDRDGNPMLDVYDAASNADTSRVCEYITIVTFINGIMDTVDTEVMDILTT